MVGRAWCRPVLLAALAAATLPTDPPDPPATTPYVPGEVIVKFRETVGEAEKSATLASLGALRIRKLPGIEAEHARLKGLTVDEAIKRFSKHPAVEFIEPNYRVSIQEVPNDPDFHLLWGLENLGQTGGTPGADISATNVWDVFTGSREILVAVIDTGVDYTHPDLAANIFLNPGEFEGNGIDDDGNGFIDDVRGWDFDGNDNNPIDDHGHGTHVAGTLGAVGNDGRGITGVSWQVSILPMKFLDQNGTGSNAAAIQAIDYAVTMGARILNNSWGGNSFSLALRLAVQRAEEAGVLFVAAAGNSTPSNNNDQVPFFPASYDLSNIISVAATDHDDQLANFSNYGATTVDLAAPGVDIYSTVRAGDYAFLNGTSMATPHVAGALALIMGRFPDIEGPDARALLLNSVDPLPALEGVTVTGGRLNAFLPIADPDDIPPAPVTDLLASNPESARVDLAWSATGDDGNEGVASRYDLRYSTVPIDNSSFSQAERIRGTPDPQPPGGAESMRITGLQAATTYYFALRVLDEFGNASPLSNVAVETTVGPPELTVAPEAISADLFTGGTANRSLILDNSGVGELLYEVVVERPAADNSSSPDGGSGSGLRRLVRPSSTRFAELPSLGGGPLGDPGRPSPTEGSLTIASSREVTDETAANGTRYSYHEFDSLGGHFTGIYQLFGDVQPSYVRFYVRSGSREMNDGYFVLRDLGGQEAIFFFAAADGHFFVNADVGGNDSVPYAVKTWHKVEFRNISFATRDFDYFVDDVLIQENIPFRTPTVQNFHRLDIYNFGDGAEAWWDEIVLSNIEPPSLVVVEPQVGVVPAGGRAELDVELNASGLIGGDHPFTILVRTNDPDEGEVRVPVVLHVTGAADIRASETALDFGSLFVGGTTRLELEISNAGTDVLSVSSMLAEPGDFVITERAFDLAPAERHSFLITFTPGREGTIAGSLTLSSNDPDTPDLVLPMTGVGLIPPDIEVRPESLEELLSTGSRGVQPLVIENTGFSTLSWEIAFPVEGDLRLERVLSELNDTGIELAATIPFRYAFYEGQTGFSISDGGNDMYRGGNFLSTSLGSFVEYSGKEIRQDPIFGENGRYFTARYPGLFVLAADLDGVDTFTIVGNLGGNDFGKVEGSVLETRANGETYVGFVKRVWNAGSPSVNHLIIVPAQEGLAHQFSDNPKVDFHRVVNLAGSTRLYYLLYAGMNGAYIDDDDTLRIMKAFLATLHFAPRWLDVVPRFGEVPAGATTEVDVVFDATGQEGGDFSSEVFVLSNVPGDSTVGVPVALSVDPAADLELEIEALDFGRIFVGETATRTFNIGNVGVRNMTVAIAVTGDEFTSSIAEVVIPRAESRTVEVEYRPVAPGLSGGSVRITTNDPDDPERILELTGESREPPRIDVSPLSLSTSLRSGEQTTRPVTIRNLSGSDLVFNAIAQHGGGSATAAAAEAPADDVVSDTARPSPIRDGFAPEQRPETVTRETWRPRLGISGEPEDEGSFLFEEDFEDGDFDGWLGRGGGLRSEESAPRVRRIRPPVAEPRKPANPPAPSLAADNRIAGGLFDASPFAATVPAGTSVDVTVTFNAAGANGGLYRGQLRIDSNDPSNRVITVDLELSVIGQPDIAASQENLDFGTVRIGQPQNRSVTITNFGTDMLRVTDVRAAPSVFAANVSSFELQPGKSRSVVVTFDPIQVGPTSGALTLFSNDPVTPELSIGVSGSALLPARLETSPESIAISQHAGLQQQATLTVTNEGGEDLIFEARPRTVEGRLVQTKYDNFVDDIEAGANGWTTEIFVGSGLWHRTGQRGVSGTSAWWCSDETTGTYASEERVSTALISRPIDLRELEAPVTLSFFESFETEPGWDQCLVDLSIDGGDTWIPLRGSYGAAPSGNSGGFVQEFLDLSRYVGEIVRIRFYFETLDATNNAFPGWVVDDVVVTSKGTAWVTVTPGMGVIAPGGQQELAVAFDAVRFRPPGLYLGQLEVVGNDPFDPDRSIPVSMRVEAPPRIGLPGNPIVVASERDVSSSASRHYFSVDRPPGGPGTLELVVEGNFAANDQTATATAEAFVLGAIGGSGTECGATSGEFPVSALELAELARDGVIELDVRNSTAVGLGCPVNRHSLRLSYPAPVERLDFGDVPVGSSTSLSLPIANHGAGRLEVASIDGGSTEIQLSATTLTVEPQQQATLTVTYAPVAAGQLGATLAIVSNDPREPLVTVALSGRAASMPARAIVEPDAVEAALPPHSTRTRNKNLRLVNGGEGDLIWSVEPLSLGSVSPDAGVVPPGDLVDIVLRFESATLTAGDYTAPLILNTNDPDLGRIEIPLTLHVGQVDLMFWSVDFSPKFAERPGTVEVALQLPRRYDPDRVLVPSVRFVDVPALADPVAVHDTNRDGVPELILQFDAGAVERALAGSRSPLVTIDGEVLDTIWFGSSRYLRGVAVIDPVGGQP